MIEALIVFVFYVWFVLGALLWHVRYVQNWTVATGLKITKKDMLVGFGYSPVVFLAMVLVKLVWRI